MFALILAATVAAPAHVNERVEVDGHVFRVQVESASVTVADKAIITKRTPEQRERMKRAVVIATNGCRIDEPYWEAAKLRGLLDCKPAP